MSLVDDTCDNCGGRFDPMGDPLLTKHPEIGPYAVFCAACETPTQPPAAPETDVRLTEAEREAWDVDPDLWPHTPPLHIFRALMDEDDNLWWRASGGHGLNAYDAAIERIDELEERVRVVEGERDAAQADHHVVHQSNDTPEIVCSCGVVLSVYGLTRSLASVFGEHVRTARALLAGGDS